jgi:hypothetical protein
MWHSKTGLTLRDGFGMPHILLAELDEEANGGARFSAEKSCEPVPRPNASDGEHLSRGRLPLPTSLKTIVSGGVG